ncbi:MAG: GNAT family N-acetyltransferase [Actinomycetota bacterium]
MITIRDAEPGDAEAMGLAHALAWQVAYRGMVADSYLDAIEVPVWVDRWRRILAGELAAEGVDPPENVVAEVDGEVVGFANVGRFRGAPDDPSLGELWAMYVHPDHWGTGAGYELMQATMAVFQKQKFERVYLWVLEDNQQARRFYERQGWRAETETMTGEFGGEPVAEIRYTIEL